ncbi:transketolase C-terminal domain-containing protein, partial [Bacillus velezensis]
AEEAYAGVEKGAYIVSKAQTESPAALLLATGSEVGLAIEAQAKLAEENIHVSVVSMPSWDRFEKQSAEYKNSVLPPNVTKRLAIEMGSSFGWGKFTGLEGDVLAIDRFGASAPGETIMKEYGFTAENVVDRVKKLLNK